MGPAETADTGKETDRPTAEPDIIQVAELKFTFGLRPQDKKFGATSLANPSFQYKFGQIQSV